MCKAVFLDRDGTINIDRDYIYRISDFEFIPKAVEGMRLLQDAGFKLIVITNQSGIARGYYSEEDYRTLNEWMIGTLADEYKVNICASYYCPHHPEGIVSRYRQNCSCRKPGTELFKMAIKEFNIDLSHSFAIGDKMRDLSICEGQNEGGNCRGFLIGTKEEEYVIEQVKRKEVQGVQYAANLYEAAEQIVNESVK